MSMAGAVRAAIVAQKGKKKGWDARGRRGRSGSRRVAVDGEKHGAVKKEGPYGEAAMSTRHKHPLWKESKLSHNRTPLERPGAAPNFLRP